MPGSSETWEPWPTVPVSSAQNWTPGTFHDGSMATTNASTSNRYAAARSSGTSDVATDLLD